MTFFKRSSVAKTVLAIAALSASATTVLARPDLRQMTCAQAQQMVRQQGAVVFTTGQYTYSQFVSNLSYCDPRQQLFRQYGPTKDNPRCPVAFKCEEPLFESNLFNRWN
ncbi:hypothetical protein JM93_04174 [Roseibium hamelinense]|uniref:Secreted protein n=1 Tax=Roseibium hamelinense TaxID=150831 RepID=A0A562SFB5_9HYPH|nr:hypothetical protein [Roseibium hamelinense]MTI44156.1 hypothetical protein [Roseibium hamelinense]TWI80061.1 hypothetical protein JM93_04174 [Roseibium hamelinense]